MEPKKHDEGKGEKEKGEKGKKASKAVEEGPLKPPGEEDAPDANMEVGISC